LAQGAPRRPNIVVILGDDLGFADMGMFGSEIKTPNLDALAREGVRFTNFYTHASCSPTRSMLLSGVDTHRNGLGNMDEYTAQDLEPEAYSASPVARRSSSSASRGRPGARADPVTTSRHTRAASARPQHPTGVNRIGAGPSGPARSPRAPSR
jgi:hypothetical protein